jgi:TonB family protein
MRRTRQFASFIFGVAIAAVVVAQTPGAGPNIPRVQLSEAETAAKIIYRVPPIYPTQARAAHIEGTAVFSAIVGKDGSIVSMQTISGHPLLTRAALEVVPKWRYQPTLRDGEPVEVATTITVTFKLSDQPGSEVNSVKSSPLATSENMVDSDNSSPEIIYLKNGRTIHADSASEAGNKLEYTIGDSIYEIPDSLVKQIVHTGGAPSSPSHSTTVSKQNVVSAPSLSKMPIPYGDL